MPWKPLPGSADEEPRKVGTPLDQVMKRLGAASAGTEQSVFDAWPELVGANVARAATPSSLRDGVLVVAVTDPAWATQLRFLEAELLAKIAERFGPAEVTKVDVRVRSATARRTRGS